MELLITVAVFVSLRCDIEWNMIKMFSLEFFPILLGSNSTDLGDCMILVRAHVSSIPITMVQLCYDQGFMVFSLQNVGRLHPQGTFLLHVNYGKEHIHAEIFSHLQCLAED